MKQSAFPRADRQAPVAGDRKAALFNTQARPAMEVWTRRQLNALYGHLHNGNDSTRFVMAFRDAAGKTIYTRSRKQTAERAISWSIGTTFGKATSKLAFAPYSQNAQGCSRWAAMDFDAHDGNAGRALELAFAAFRAALDEPSIFLILETSGSGGWHLWMIRKDFAPASQWLAYLRGIVKAIGATVAKGVCELFPAEDGQEYGLPVRAPGSWNPRTDRCNEVLWENIQPLLDGDILGKVPATLPNKKEHSSFASPSEEQKAPAALYRRWESDWRSRFAIIAPSTRHDQLYALVGECFRQVGFNMARRLAQAQFEGRAVATDGDLELHLDEFARCWRGLSSVFAKELTDAERAVLTDLRTENEADFFRIVHSFARKAVIDGAQDFPLSSGSVAERLGITVPGVGYLRDILVKKGVLVQTAPYVPHRSAGRYRWNLPKA